MQDVLGINILGWVLNNKYKTTKEKVREIKAKMLDTAETDKDRIGIQNYFPFDDFNENS
jgi:hypothetical protein